MENHPPLPTLLSQALVAFTIEFDNEFERQTPHHTASFGYSGSPYAPMLISRVIWMMLLRFIPEDGISVAELEHVAGVDRKALDMWLTRMSKWWGHLTIESPESPATRSKRIPPTAMVRFSPRGRTAAAAWRPLTGEIEGRWRKRFGKSAIDRLRKSLHAVVAQLDPSLPDYLPILGYGLFSAPNRRPQLNLATVELSLPALLSKVRWHLP